MDVPRLTVVALLALACSCDGEESSGQLLVWTLAAPRSDSPSVCCCYLHWLLRSPTMRRAAVAKLISRCRNSFGRLAP